MILIKTSLGRDAKLKKIGIFLSIFCLSHIAFADFEWPDGRPKHNKDKQYSIGAYTQKAFTSYKFVGERLDYFGHKLRKITFDEYTEDLLLIAPFVSGNFTFKIWDVNLKYDYYEKSADLSYKLKF